jgi:membrane associated rhomboid family serine protease
MLSDRPYMRDADYPRNRSSVLVWLIAAILAVFVLQIAFILLPLGGRGVPAQLLGLTADDLKSFQVWRLLTYSFVHSSGNLLLHLLGNVLGLYFIGREVLPLVGSRRFLGFYAAAVVAGGLAWSAVNWNHGGLLVGASAGVMGLLAVFACFYPHRPITLLIFFVLPVTVKPKHLALGLAAFDLLGFLIYELPHATNTLGIAHSSHLGGMAAGWIFYRFVHESRWSASGSGTSIELPAWLRRVKKAQATTPVAYKVNVSPPAASTSSSDLRAEVDRILDKINSQGFAALTPEEKRRLDQARDLLSRR